MTYASGLYKWCVSWARAGLVGTLDYGSSHRPRVRCVQEF